MTAHAATLRRLSAATCMLIALLIGGCAGVEPQGAQDDVATLMKQGEELYATKNYDEAIRRFKEVVAKDPKRWQAYLWLARAYIAKGLWGDAIASARTAYQLSASGQEVVAVLAEALFGGGADALRANRFKDAISYFTDYIKLQPGNARAYLNVARAFLGEKRLADALSSVIKGLSVASAGTERSELLRALLDGGLQSLTQGDFRSAIGFFGEYLKIDPANVRAYIDLARSYVGTGDYALALSAFRRGLAQGGQRPELLRALADTGRQALTTGRAKEAIGFLREYVNHDRGNLNAYLDLAKSYWQSGERINALNAFRRVLELDPRHDEALRFLRGG